MRVIRFLAILMIAPIPGAAQQRCSPHASVMPDRPAQVGPSPDEDDAVRYPAAMRHSGVTGVVRLRFTVCADGEIDPASLVVVRASHEEFVPGAVWALSRMRALPAFYRGVAVNQVVELVMRMVPRDTPPKRRSAAGGATRWTGEAPVHR